MKRLVAAGGLLLFAATAFAQQTVMVPASKEAVIKRIYTSPEDFRLYKGDYSLSNGKTLQLTRKHTRMYARVDQQSEHEIVQAREGKFVALDGKMDIELALSDGGSVQGQLSYVDETTVAAGQPPQKITLAIR